MPETEIVQPRKLHEIAADIANCWKAKPASANTMTFAVPYLNAISQMEYVEDMYGAEYGDMVVCYLLNNIRNWRGEDAKRIKKELNAMIHAYNDGVRYRK